MNNRVADKAVPPLSARRAMRTWVGIIVGMLTLQVGLCAWGVYCATKGGGTVVEADYYDKALHWDDHLAMERASEKLGWKVELTVGDAVSTRGGRALMLRLTDSQGAPITGAMVEAAFFHHARPREMTQLTLKDSAAGLYATSAQLDRKGIWEFRLTIHRGADTFIETLQRDLLE